MSYQDLFPGADDALSGIDQTPNGAAEGGGRAKVPLPNSGHELVSKIDIPLFFRQTTKFSKATAEIGRRSDGAWYFVFVDGDPHLRAVLFECLRAANNRQAVGDFLSSTGKSSFKISLRQVTEISADARAPFADQVRWDGRVLVIERKVFQGVPPSGVESALSVFGGISLPDAEADRARLRDRMELKRLETSAAFISPIRNRNP